VLEKQNSFSEFGGYSILRSVSENKETVGRIWRGKESVASKVSVTNFRVAC
jgi:hypothetical protein